MLREVISVIQDLPYRRQLEILLRDRTISAFLDLPKFREYFVMPDAELVWVAGRTRFYSEYEFSELTRLIVLYIMSMPNEPSLKMEKEFSNYCDTLTLEQLVQLRSMIRSYSSLEYISWVIEYKIIVKHPALSKVRKLYRSIADFANRLFRFLVDVRSEHVTELIDDTTDESVLAMYIMTLLALASEEHLSQVVNRYVGIVQSQTNLTEDKIRDRLIRFIVINTDRPDEPTRARMLFSLNPQSDLSTFLIAIRRTNDKLFSAFVAETVDLFDWEQASKTTLTKHERNIADDILNNQV